MAYSDKKILIKILIVVCTISAACSFAKEKNEFVMQNAKQVTHPNGLTVKIPQDYTAKQTENGFVIEPENNDLRVPISIYVSVINDGRAAEEDSNFRTKRLAGKTVRYSVKKSEGGSGGETYALTAFETIKGGFIKYSQAAQSKYAEPDFALAWQTIENSEFSQ